MSINVNVHGNPVSVRRGKIVNAVDPDYAQKEFSKRRRIRLEQVRQQSKEIAESVRNKVRCEKNKQKSDLEKQSEKELKKWQNRKLLQLQQQYQDCLKDIGIAHTDAILEEESDYLQESRKESNDQIAKERGHRANEKLHEQKLEKHHNKSRGAEKRQYHEIVEKTRAKMVANLNRKKKSKSPFKKKKRKVSTDINISRRLSGDSEDESEMPQFLHLESSNSSLNSSTSITDTIADNHIDTVIDNTAASITKEPVINQKQPIKVDEIGYQDKHEKPLIRSIGQQCGHNFERYSRDDHRDCCIICSQHNTARREAYICYPFDTRISDRIKQRNLTNIYNYEPPPIDVCDRRDSTKPNIGQITSNNQFQPVKLIPNMKESAVQTQSYTSRKSVQEELPSRPSINLRTVPQNSKQLNPGTSSNLPTRPSITLHTVPQNSEQLNPSTSSNLDKVQYYDHTNRFNKEYTRNGTSVHKIPESSLQVCPSSGSEAEFTKQMFKRDHDAEIRGHKAFEKEKVYRDYKEMMNQLQKLQKQERIAAIPSTKSKFHMSDDRLKLNERKRQNRMENVYEQLFSNRQIVTIPPKEQQTNLPFKPIRIVDGPPNLNVGSWDIDVKPKFALGVTRKHGKADVREDPAKISIGAEEDQDKATLQRKQNLEEMLASLKFQRNKLAEELSTLPEDSNIRNLFGELETVDNIIKVGQAKDENSTINYKLKHTHSRKKGKRKDDKVSLSSLNSPFRKRSQDGDEHTRKDPEKERKGSKYHTRCVPASTPSVSSPSTINTNIYKSRNEQKATKPAVLILQNTSTQTTPTIQESKIPVTQRSPKSHSDPKKSAVDDKSKAEKNVALCGYNSDMINSNPDVCEIVIKFSEDGKSQICVCPTPLHNSKQFILKNDKEEKTSDTYKSFIPKPKKQVVQDTTVPDKAKFGRKTDDKVKKSKPQQKSSFSWREYLSQNSTSSTSYLSPPNFSSTHVNTNPPNDFPSDYIATAPKINGHLINILKDKPQQSNVLDNNSSISNVSSTIERTNPTILRHINKLLTMSRGSIDELAVSSVSELSTPSSSIINVQTNIPLLHFENIMKQFNVNLSEMEDYFNYSPGSNTLHNSVASSSSSNNSKSPTDNCETEISVLQERRNTVEIPCTENCPEVVEAYNKLAKNCAKKIESLAAMIQKVRLENVCILQSTSSESEKEVSTKYLNLPTDNYKSPSPDSVVEQEELCRQLLEVDFSLAKRLKKTTPAAMVDNFVESTSTTSSTSSGNSNHSNDENSQRENSLDEELMTRFRNLVESHKISTKPISTCHKKDKTNPDAPFVPLLADIPRLPNFVPLNISKPEDRSKPPPSKGLKVAKRFNNNISGVPHELSTIVEAESLVLNKLHKSKSPERRISNETILPNLNTKRDSNLPKHVCLCDENISNQQQSSTDSVPDIIAELIKNAQDQMEYSEKSQQNNNHNEIVQNNLEFVSDSSASEIENMEAMLKSLGMGWAVATLKKTQEALALTSSSSSIDISLKQKEVKYRDASGSTSEISLREILGKQFLSNFSSTSKSNDSNGSSRFLRELQDVSITEIANRRTSTPVQSSKTTDKSKSDSQRLVTITCESDLSSVRAGSDHNCDGVAFYSLNESSVRSKNSSKND